MACSLAEPGDVKQSLGMTSRLTVLNRKVSPADYHGPVLVSLSLSLSLSLYLSLSLSLVAWKATASVTETDSAGDFTIRCDNSYSKDISTSSSQHSIAAQCRKLKGFIFLAANSANCKHDAGIELAWHSLDEIQRSAESQATYARKVRQQEVHLLHDTGIELAWHSLA